jgi:dihydroxycyclohexadiene carboxylate dehydrogenase
MTEWKPKQVMILVSRLSEKIAIVTGAAQGVGRATARFLAREGATVVLVDRDSGLCAATLRDIEAAGGRAAVVEADLQAWQGAKDTVDRVLQMYGKIDVAVHNVGGSIWAKPFWEYPPEQIEAEISRSLWPTLWCCRAVIPVMLRQKAGAIVNIGSAATRWTYRVPYSAAKGAVHAMTVCMARELADSGVRVNCVSPGALDNADRITPRNPSPLSEAEAVWRREAYAQSLAATPMGRLGQADEIAGAVCFLASGEASYITGQVLFVAGGEFG